MPYTSGERNTMNPTSDTARAQDSRLLAETLDLGATVPGTANSWKCVVVLKFHSKHPSGLRQRIAQADPDCVAVEGCAGVLVVVRDSSTLRQLAEMSVDLCLGLGHRVPVSGIFHSLHRALDALAFTNYSSALSRAIACSELGSLTALAKLTRAELEGLPDMAMISAIHDQETGRAGLEAVEALCRTGTLRKAAVALHLHHSSVDSRIQNVEAALGHRLTGAIPLCTAYAAILGLRLLATRVPSKRQS